MIYLDFNATTPLLVFAAMEPYLTRFHGNPSSVHQAGRETRAAIDNSRDRLATLLGAKPHEIIFTGGGTEADNLAILGLARHLSPRGKHLITAQTEHHAVLHAMDRLEKREGFRVTRLPVDSAGRIDPAQLQDAFAPDTVLVSIMLANNETGTLQPIPEIARLCRERGALFHSDMIQSFGKLPLDVRSAGPDAISLAAHKFYGPKGAGLLWLRAGVGIEAIAHGGAHENQRRPGTENVAAIVGMAAAAELVLEGMAAEQARQAALRDRLWAGVREAFPGAVLNGDPIHRLGNTLNVSLPGVDSEAMLMNLDLEGICASSGSACMVGSVMQSHVLAAMGRDAELVRSAIRFSLGKLTTAVEIEDTSAALRRIAARAGQTFA